MVAAVLLIVTAGAAALRLSRGDARGTVVSLTRGTPIPGASIQSPSGSVVSDRFGRFAVPGLPVGSNAVTVAVPGFEPFTATLTVSSVNTIRNRIILRDATLKGALAEVAAEPQTVTSATVQVGPATATVGPDGEFEIKGLRPGLVVVRASGPGHELTETTLTLSPGGNEATAAIWLTPAETYRRYSETLAFGHWAIAYSYLHPDARRTLSLSAFTKLGQQGGTTISVTIGKTRMVAHWRSPYTKRRYDNVALVDRTLIYQVLGTRYTDNYSQHWVNLGGLWFFVLSG